MHYRSVLEGTFLKRPNRFIAHVLLDQQEVIAHVPNTGRCRELLVPGATVYLEPSDNPKRKTQFSLVAVRKNNRLINMDSGAPNKVVASALKNNKALTDFPTITGVTPEYTYGDSRLDFLLTTAKKEILMEVKGVTLEVDGAALFPDAPTQRGVKHINELIAATKEGYGAAIFFVIQMENITHFTPNDRTHPQFGEALRLAQAAGVHILAYDCLVTPNTLQLNQPVPVLL